MTRWRSTLLAAIAAMAMAAGVSASAVAKDAQLPNRANYMEAMKGMAEPLVTKTKKGGTVELRQDMYRYILEAVATAYLNYVNADPIRSEPWRRISHEPE